MTGYIISFKLRLYKVIAMREIRSRDFKRNCMRLNALLEEKKSGRGSLMLIDVFIQFFIL